MVTQPEEQPSGLETPEAAANASLNAVLVAAQQQLRDVLDQATTEARQQVEAAAAAVALRESEMAAREASLMSERLRLDAERNVMTEQVSAVNERQRVLDAQTEEVEKLNERATASLADALDRAAQLIEQAEARVRVDESRSSAQVEAELKDARTHAGDIHEQAAKRVEAVRVESEATLRRAVERGMGIVSSAEASAERSKSDLRELVDRIEEFLRRASLTDIDLKAELEIDLRAESDATAAAEAAVDEPELTNVTRFVARADAPGGSEESVRAAVAVAGQDAMDAYSDPAAPEPVEASEVDPAEQRVAKAVRRAVRGWSAAREEAQ